MAISWTSPASWARRIYHDPYRSAFVGYMNTLTELRDSNFMSSFGGIMDWRGVDLDPLRGRHYGEELNPGRLQGLLLLETSFGFLEMIKRFQRNRPDYPERYPDEFAQLQELLKGIELAKQRLVPILGGLTPAHELMRDHILTLARDLAFDFEEEISGEDFFRPLVEARNRFFLEPSLESLTQYLDELPSYRQHMVKQPNEEGYLKFQELDAKLEAQRFLFD